MSHTVYSPSKIQQSIQEMSLRHNGNAFTYELSFNYSITYSPSGWGKNKYWKPSWDGGGNQYAAQEAAKQYTASLPAGTTYSVKENVLKDGRDPYLLEKGNRLAFVNYAIVVTVNVPKHLSWDMFYRNYAKDGYPFRDYLLTHRRAKLQEIINLIKSYRSSHFYGLEISSGYITDDWSADRDNIVSFRKLGLADLTSTPERFGLALAILELLGVNKDSYYFEDNRGNILTCKKYIPAPQPATEPW